MGFTVLGLVRPGEYLRIKMIVSLPVNAYDRPVFQHALPVVRAMRSSSVGLSACALLSELDRYSGGLTETC